MSRVARMHALPEHGIFHARQRGVAGLPIVLDDDDRRAFVFQLEEVERRFGFEALAWCLVDNHAHLLVQTSRELLQRAMHRLAFLYAQRFNRRYHRLGHLFEGRFRARAIDPEDDAEFERVRDYVYFNPERHGLIEPGEPW